ncbi:TetR/AcrR family transcriptional regulator [Roseateles amylovorans]|uniref:TetR/AcrR family transcriptional regulator n=1 Tax=Roseateles amylovorans TaxID=2978473 RepID=A0ABY6B1P3_9BURK|nr:TetR/AcrR family transcriptional regulator [Roseateles amylovorans]UXH77899.1 TetR/AcrR family transcriptional regulator [Roseateles amylovorans]
MVSKPTSPDPRPSGPKGLHRSAGVVQEAPTDADTRPLAKPQPRVRQKLVKPEGPLKRQAQRKGAEADPSRSTGTAAQQRRAAQKQALEAGILAAARDLFAARGPEAVTLREVGAAVGYSHATLYSFFADKNELLTRLAQDSLQTLLIRLQGALDGAEPGAEPAAVARAFVQWGLQHPHDYRLLMLDTPLALRSAVMAGLGEALPLPAERGAALWAGLHGLVMLELGGLAALGGELPRSKRLAALLAGL